MSLTNLGPFLASYLAPCYDESTSGTETFHYSFLWVYCTPEAKSTRRALTRNCIARSETYRTERGHKNCYHVSGFKSFMSICSPNQYSKSDSLDSAIDRTPPEIWWDILDQVLYDQLLFSMIYQGGYWTTDTRRFLLMGSYEQSEFQRKMLGSVCRLWQVWSQSRRYRCITLNPDSPTFDLEVTTAIKAQRVTISQPIGDNAISSFSQGVDWEIICIHQRVSAEFARIQRPRLRRLQLVVTNEHPFDPDAFLKVLGIFKNITWFDYQAYPSSERDIPVNADRSPVVLPNLQALIYQPLHRLRFPYSISACHLFDTSQSKAT
ncbi:hypothetical protein CPB86DRAFT_256928 [Serendipita vermifera]|nr:hypothetical protein CPB86DRAFT_256928 [Serendipita vermifera]